MKRYMFLITILFILLISCAKGPWPFGHLWVGKSFAVIAPKEVKIHTEPRIESGVFYLVEHEAFIIDDVFCEGGKVYADCFMLVMEYPEVVFFKARFESGKEGYINGVYFYPKLSYYLTSEERSAYIGMTPKEDAADSRRQYKEAEIELNEMEKKRLSAIVSSAWPDEIKQLVIDRRLKPGMTKEQVMLSQNPPDTQPFKPLKKVSETVAEEGVFEKWVYDNSPFVSKKKFITYYFLNNILVRWEETVE